MKKLIAIYGINGAGKTTLVKNLLMSDYVSESDGDFLLDCFDFFEKKSPYGTYTVSKGEKYVAVGGYSNKCGGADSIKTVENYFAMINFLVEKYPNSTLCVEGVLQKAIGDLINCYENLKSKGYEPCLIKLETSLNQAVERVKNRNGLIPNIECIKSKVTNTGRLFKKLQDCGKFNCYVIYTDNRTVEQVYEEFERVLSC